MSKDGFIKKAIVMVQTSFDKKYNPDQAELLAKGLERWDRDRIKYATAILINGWTKDHLPTYANWGAASKDWQPAPNTVNNCDCVDGWITEKDYRGGDTVSPCTKCRKKGER